MHFSHVVESPRALLEWNTKHHKWRESNWICLYPTACLWFYPPGEDIIRTMISRETAKSFSSFADRMHCASCSATAHTAKYTSSLVQPNFLFDRASLLCVVQLVSSARQLIITSLLDPFWRSASCNEQGNYVMSYNCIGSWACEDSYALQQLVCKHVSARTHSSRPYPMYGSIVYTNLSELITCVC